MTGKYGTFNDEQLKKFKKKLHSKVHWLLLYKEKNNCDNCLSQLFYHKIKKQSRKFGRLLSYSLTVISVILGMSYGVLCACPDFLGNGCPLISKLITA